MKNMTVVLLESRAVYGERLAAYISRQEASPFHVALYLEHPVSEAQWKKADVILMTSSLEGTYQTMMHDVDKDGQRVMMLDEEGKGFEDGRTAIYKYQSAAVIYEALLDFCVDKSGKKLLGNGKTGKNWMLMGIYTPMRGETVTRAVLDMCRGLAADGRVLYLNMEQIPVFQTLMEESDRKEGMSELIYYVKQHSKNLGARMGMLVIRGEFDYILPADTPAELEEMTQEEWQFCLDHIRQETEYETVLLDFGASVPPSDFLDICGSWLIVHENTAWEQRLIRQFRRILARLMDEGWEEKIREIGPDEWKRGRRYHEAIPGYETAIADADSAEPGYEQGDDR